ncbi:MAG: hypothetical protein E3J72_12025 [Planctomycetota bacterium]|nr:MAG: hypothetical protein E3J72_12025 [Planctomycetota bacterium]
MKDILDAAKRAKEFIDKHKDDPEVKAICADLRDLYAAFAEGDEEKLSHIASVDPDVIKAIELSEKLDTLRQKREKANAFFRFCADVVKIVLAAKGFKL